MHSFECGTPLYDLMVTGAAFRTHSFRATLIRRRETAAHSPAAGAGGPQRVPATFVDDEVPVVLRGGIGAWMAGCAGRPDRMSRRVVDDEVAVVLHDGDGAAGAVGGGRPQRAGALIEDEIAVKLQDQVEPPVARGEGLVRIERLPGLQECAVGWRLADAEDVRL